MRRRYALLALVGLLSIGVAVPALGGPSPIGKTSASAKKLATKAYKRAKKADKRARRAQNAANNAESAANAAQAAADANTAKLSCDAGLVLIAGVCVETTQRTAASGAAAETACNDAGGSLPSQETLILFRNTTGADLGDPAEWTSDIGIDTGGLGDYRLIVGDGGVHSYQMNLGVDYNYRCVHQPGGAT